MKSKVCTLRVLWLVLSTVLFLLLLLALTPTKTSQVKEPEISLELLHQLPHIDVIVSDLTLSSLNTTDFYTQMKLSGKLTPDYIDSNYYGHGYAVLNVFIDSNGGDFYTGMNIADYFKKLREKYGFIIKCYVAKANSMAFTILQQCTLRNIFEGGYLGIHRVYGSTKYNNFVGDLQRAAYEIENTKRVRKDLVDMRTKETKYFNAQEALDSGFVDEVIK